MNPNDIFLPKSVVIRERQARNVPGLRPINKNIVSLIDWINERIEDRDIELRDTLEAIIIENGWNFGAGGSASGGFLDILNPQIQSVVEQPVLLTQFYTTANITSLTVVMSKDNSNPITLSLIDNETASVVDFTLPLSAQLATTTTFDIPANITLGQGLYSITVQGDDYLTFNQIIIN